MNVRIKHPSYCGMRVAGSKTYMLGKNVAETSTVTANRTANISSGDPSAVPQKGDCLVVAHQFSGQSQKVTTRDTPAPQAPAVMPSPVTTVLEREQENSDQPWLTIVWDDPINLMRYVTYVLQTVFGYSEPQAHKLMLQVHNEGKAAVSSGTREQMEHDVKKLQTFGLWATLQQGGGS